MTENEEYSPSPEIEPTPEPSLTPLAQVTNLADKLRVEVKKVVYGQDDTVTQILAALLAGGHVLLEGKPGLGKTHMVLALASTFGLSLIHI